MKVEILDEVEAALKAVRKSESPKASEDRGDRFDRSVRYGRFSRSSRSLYRPAAFLFALRSSRLS